MALEVIAMEKGSGYVAAAAGSTVGAAPLAVAGGAAAAAYANATGIEGLQAFWPVLFWTAAGFLVGAGLGCWVGLKLARHARAGATAVILMLLLPAWVVVGFVALTHIPASTFILEIVATLFPGPGVWVVQLYGAALLVAVPAVAARAIVLRVSGRPAMPVGALS